MRRKIRRRHEQWERQALKVHLMGDTWVTAVMHGAWYYDGEKNPRVAVFHVLEQIKLKATAHNAKQLRAALDRLSRGHTIK